MSPQAKKQYIEERLKKFKELFTKAQQNDVPRHEALRLVMKYGQRRDAKA